MRAKKVLLRVKSDNDRILLL